MSWTAAAFEAGQLEPDALAELDKLTPMTAPKGTVLFRPGETVKGYVIVLSGKIGVYLIGPTGRDILMYRVELGQSCIQSTLGLMGGEDYSGEAITEADTTLVLLPRSVFLDLIDKSPGFRRLVFSAFARRLQSMMHLLESVAFQKVRSRLAGYLLAQANADAEIRMTQSQLATAIGSAREVISRRLDSLKSQGCIHHERGLIKILNPEYLRFLAEENAV